MKLFTWIDKKIEEVIQDKEIRDSIIAIETRIQELQDELDKGYDILRVKPK